jgi:hypothetical protein
MKTRAAAIVVGVTTAAALAALCVRGLYLRWYADDYWIVGATATRGFWGGQALWYRIWSGRYVSTFGLAVLVSTGPRTTALIVILTVLGMIAAFRARLRWPLALAMTWAILLGTSDVPQSVLWQTGLFCYTIPLAVFAWWLARAAGREQWRWFDFVVPLASGGCSETGVLTQLVVCAIAFAAWRRKPMLAAFLASLISLAIMAAAPGNGVRKSAYPPMPPLARVIETTAGDAVAFFVDTFDGAGMVLLFVFLASALFAPPVSRRLWIVATLCAIACVFVTFVPAEATMLMALPQRARIIPYAFLVAAVMALGAAVPRQERWRGPLSVALMITAIMPLITAVQMAREVPQTRTFAQRWDRLDAFLRTNRGRKVFVDGAPVMVGTLLFLGHDPVDNNYMSDSYGLRSLVRMPPYRAGRLVIGPLPIDAVRYRFDYP